jgi:UDP-GlcNAc:undecaprenyl-phosphate/decaprenyl-phosphate GlcNAc-1-phosphate transferase
MTGMPWPAFWVAFALSAAITPLVIAFAHRQGITARAREDRWSTHFTGKRRPPALLGGVGIYLALAVGAALYLPWNRQMAGIAAGATFMFLTGLVDDRIGLRPYLKMAAQTVAACILLATGTTVTVIPIPWVAAVATIFWVIAITNAVNLIDNMDGLASGVIAVSALTLAFYGVGHGLPSLTSLALLVAGACSGFLLYNFNPARVFMGDCGSLLLGFLMSAAALAGTARAASNLVLALFVPVILLAVPVFDTALVSVVRRANGRPISQGGRDHSSHRLVALGLSERGTVVLLYAISAVFGLLAIASARLSTAATLVLVALMFGALTLFGIFLGMVQVYTANTGQPEPFEGRGTLLGGTLLHKKQAVQLLLDVGLIPLSLVAANLLRFEGAIPRQIFERLAEGLPYVIVARIACLAAARGYQGIWRYAGLSDVVAVLKGSTAGSLVAATALWMAFGLEGYSRTALIIDWMAFTGLAVAARTGFVLLDHLFTSRSDRGAHRVVVVGANEMGLAAVRELQRLRNGSSTVPVAFLDEDRTKHHCSVGGIPIVGAVVDLPEVVLQLQANSVVIAVGGEDQPEDAARRAAALCDTHDIPYQRWVGLAARSTVEG